MNVVHAQYKIRINNVNYYGCLKDDSSVRIEVDDVSLLSACLMDDACATVKAFN